MERLLRNTLAILSLSLILFSGSECVAEPKEGEIIATLNGEPIYLSEIEQNAAFQVYRLQANIYTLLKKETEELVNQKLLAAEAIRRNLSIEELLKKEVDEKVVPPDEKQIDEYLSRHPEEIDKAPQRRDQIKTYLHQRDLIQHKLDFVASLRQKADFQFLLKAPERPRIKVKIEGKPWRGSSEAPVTLVHFADLTSRLCAESAEKIKKVIVDFPGKIKWVHRNYFSIQDEKALMAAEFGEAAYEQGIFWNFHDLMFARKGDWKIEGIKKVASEIGLNKKQFDEGQKKGKYLLKVKEDIGYAARIGVEGAPVIFVNGLYFSGTFPYEELKTLVQKELENRAKPPVLKE